MLRRKLESNLSIKVVENCDIPAKKIKSKSNINETLIDISKTLNSHLEDMKFSSQVLYSYNPTEYAFEPFAIYINKFCTDTKKVLFVGMNPGPFGMCQTGVPFGEVNHVRDWLQITGQVLVPNNLCPQRPISGFSCTKSEISGKNFWGLFKSICGVPEKFFKNSFVYNYCPLAFMGKNGINITPNNLKGEVKKEIEKYCDRALLETIEAIEPEFVVGVGKYTVDRLLKIKKESNFDFKVIYLIHPSPIIPNNKNWPEKARKTLIEENLIKFFE